METFTEIKPFVNNPQYREQRQKTLSGLYMNNIDTLIRVLIVEYARLTFSFTMQCCYGHFVHKYQRNERNYKPLSNSKDITEVDYRIAYIALCIQDSDNGRKLFDDLKSLTLIDPDYVQFGCADWFWKKQINSFTLQVEPDRYKTKDSVDICFEEALHLESIRNEFLNNCTKL